MRFPGLGTWIERRAARSPADVALIAEGASRSYRDLAADVRAIAALLQREGVGPGDRVAFHGGNHPVALGSLFGATAIGAIWVPIHPARPEDEVRAVLEDAEPRVLIRASPMSRPETDALVFEAEELVELPADSGGLPARQPAADDLAILAYTSGTTGVPKGVMLSHANVMWAVVQMVGACAFSSSDVTLAAAPFTRMGGLGVTVLPTLFTGGVVVVPPAAEGGAVLATIERARVSVLFANPDLLEAMVRAPAWADTDLSSVRTGVVGGGLVPEGLLRRLPRQGASSCCTDTGSPKRPRSSRSSMSGMPPPASGRWASRCRSSRSGPCVPTGRPAGSTRSAPGGSEVPTSPRGTGVARRSATPRAGSRREMSGRSTRTATSVSSTGRRPRCSSEEASSIRPRSNVRCTALRGSWTRPPSNSTGGSSPPSLPTARSTRLNCSRSCARCLAPHEVPSEIRQVEGIPRNAAGKVRRADLRRALA